VSATIEAIESWVEALPGDVEVVKAVLEADGAHREARKLAAAALGYLVTRMDLIPDWNETIGVIDDTMVLRVCMDLAVVYEPLPLPSDMQLRLARLSNQVDVVKDLLGADLYTKLRRHCTRLVDTAVRGHSPARVVDDAAARTALYAEVAVDLARVPPSSSSRPDDVEPRLRSYLHHKLQQR
jgi:uncharacterized membrane protein YkvA (DUF1232 family)